VVYAIFKKQNVANPFYINRSYYIWKVEAPSNTSIVGISNWVKEEFDLEHSSSYNKLWFGMGIIMLALIGGGIVGGDGGGFVSLGIIGIGMFIGFLTFFPTGTGMNAGVIFGIMVIGFLAYIFLRGGI